MMRRRGFSLIEILTIFSILVALAYISYHFAPSVIARARDAKRKSDINRITVGIEEYRQDAQCYPKTIPACGNPLINGNLVLVPNIPCDPKTNSSYVYVPENSNCPSWFQIYGNLEYSQDIAIDKLGCREGCGPDCKYNYGASSTNQTLNPYCGAPAQPPLQYVCNTSGGCEVFANPAISRCPTVFLNDPTCQNKCSDRSFRCHDSRGKTN